MAKIPGGNDRRKKIGDNTRSQKLNRQVLSRTMILMLLCGVLVFVPVSVKLFNLMVVRHDEYEQKAIRNQTKTTQLTASRGDIYDRNMNIMASSYSVENVTVNPIQIKAAAEREEKPQDPDIIVEGLARILDVEEDFVEEQIGYTQYGYRMIKRKISAEKAAELRQFLNENNIEGVDLEPAEQRYYPYSSLAAQVMGFLSGDDVGAEGLEYYYDEALTGHTGKIITTRGNQGTAMPYTYEKYYDAENGNSLVLTLDTTVQYYLEKNLETAIEKYTVLNGGFGLVMDVNTAEILGMATIGSYDPNNRLEIYDQELAQELEQMYQSAISNAKGTDAYTKGLEEYNAAVAAARLKQWRNRAISDGYEPGSTFKLITMASALNEGAVTLNDSFYCGGAAYYEGRSQQLHCWKHGGHGQQTTAQALGNSCNLAFAQIGLKLGGGNFYDYVEAFGLLEPTGIDLPGEANGYFFPRENLTGKSTASLISGSFGQTFKVTPLQLVRAVSAVVNGGYLLEPYIVSEVQDSEGNVVQHNERTVLRQVISEETSATMRQLMEFVVTDGTASKAKTAGYRIGGKTGTSEKIDEYDENGNPVEDKMVSFIGVAPIDDPKYVVLVVLDTPSRETGLYISGGIMAAPTVRDIFTDILPYLGVEPDYSDEDISAVNVAVPNVVGLAIEQAKPVLAECSLTYRIVGEGDTITGQIPAAGAEVPGNSEIILYMDAEVPEDMTTVPDFRGMTVSQANEAAANYGVYIQASGTDKTEGYIYVTHQDMEPGTEVPRGTTVKVEFTNNTVSD